MPCYHLTVTSPEGLRAAVDASVSLRGHLSRSSADLEDFAFAGVSKDGEACLTAVFCKTKTALKKAATAWEQPKGVKVSVTDGEPFEASE